MSVYDIMNFIRSLQSQIREWYVIDIKFHTFLCLLITKNVIANDNVSVKTFKYHVWLMYLRVKIQQ